MNRSLARTLLRLLLGLLFVWAGLSKLPDPVQSYGDILAYRTGLPTGLLQTAAVVLPWVELACGLLLLFGAWTRAATVLLCALLAVFLVATGQAWFRGLDIACGCFSLAILGLDPHGALATALESAAGASIRNVVLLAATLYLLRRERGSG